MTLSRRERYIAAAALAAIVLLAADHYVLTPLLESRSRAGEEKLTVSAEIARATNLLAREKAMEAKWKGMVAGGLSSQSSDAESRILHALRDWAQSSGVGLTSVRPERVTQNGELQEESFQAVGSGPMKAIVQFLFEVEQSPLPLRIKELQLGLRKQGVDDLSLQLRVSTVYTAPPKDKKPAGAPPRAQGGEEA